MKDRRGNGRNEGVNGKRMRNEKEVFDPVFPTGYKYGNRPSAGRKEKRRA